MEIVKYIILLLILACSTYIGILMSKKYLNRVKELKEIKTALNIFKTKVEYMHEPLSEIFVDISERTSSNISNIFKKASQNMEKLDAGIAWNKSIDSIQTNLNKEDVDVIKGLGHLLGKVNVEGQVSQINLIDNFLDVQIEKAEEKRKKNEKLYKTLGTTIGLAIVIILI